jgi:hypothetical protein
MMVRDALLLSGRRLVLIALEVASRFGRNWQAMGSLSGMRGAARPDEQDENQCAEDGRQPLHRTGG